MPVPKATGTQGSNRPAPASARTHSRSFATSGVQAPRPAGTKPPAGADARGGHVPAKPCVRPGALPGSAIGDTPCDPKVAPCNPMGIRMLSQGVPERIAERMRNIGESARRYAAVCPGLQCSPNLRRQALASVPEQPFEPARSPLPPQSAKREPPVTVVGCSGLQNYYRT